MAGKAPRTQPHPVHRYLETRSPADFTRLVEETQGRLRRVALAVTRDRDLADDAVQDVYLAVLASDGIPEETALVDPTARAVLAELLRSDRPRDRQRTGSTARSARALGASHEE